MDERFDARKLNHEQLTDLRMRAIESIQNGESPYEVADILHVGVSTVFGWIALYRSGGWHALDAKKRGGRPRRLDDKTMKYIYDAVVESDPLQYKFQFALWTLKMIVTLIYKKFRIKISISSVSRLLKQMGVTRQKPIWRAYQKDDKVIDAWVKKEYPKIKRLAKKVDADVYFGDETGIRSDFHSGTTWGVKGKTPVVKSTGARFSLNVISAVNNNGGFRFKIFKGNFNSQIFIDFLKRLTHNQANVIFLIVDGHPAHKSQKVRKYLETVKERIRVFYLPPYAPELNPDEFVWNDLKNNSVGRSSINNVNELKIIIFRYLKSLQRLPEKIKSFFLAKNTLYAS